jgi:hypothetical protein
MELAESGGDQQTVITTTLTRNIVVAFQALYSKIVAEEEFEEVFFVMAARCREFIDFALAKVDEHKQIDYQKVSSVVSLIIEAVNNNDDRRIKELISSNVFIFGRKASWVLEDSLKKSSPSPIMYAQVSAMIDFIKGLNQYYDNMILSHKYGKEIVSTPLSVPLILNMDETFDLIRRVGEEFEGLGQNLSCDKNAETIDFIVRTTRKFPRLFTEDGKIILECLRDSARERNDQGASAALSLLVSMCDISIEYNNQKGLIEQIDNIETLEELFKKHKF